LGIRGGRAKKLQVDHTSVESADVLPEKTWNLADMDAETSPPGMGMVPVDRKKGLLDMGAGKDLDKTTKTGPGLSHRGGIALCGVGRMGAKDP